MTMVEKVARAIRDADAIWAARKWPDLPQEKIREFINEAGSHDAYMTLARAVIEAMREPTDAMMQAGADGSGEDSEAVASCTWEAMIDAALQEQTGNRSE